MKNLLLIAFVLISFVANAYDFEVDGLYYDIQSVSDKTCALTSGDKSYSGVINIPDSVLVDGRYMKVIAIKAGTFLDSKEISELTVPSNVTNIYGEVFAYGSSIGKLNFSYSPVPLSVGTYPGGPYSTSPRYSSFENCNPMEINQDRELSSGFSSHKSVEKLTIGNHIEHFSAGLFNDCSNLKSLRIEDSDNPIIFDYTWGQSQFKSCPISDVYIGRNFQFYHDSRNDLSPFEGKSIERLILGANVTVLEKDAFAKCSKLQSVEFPNIEEIGSNAFYECKQMSISVFPSSIRKIGYESFYSCNNILEVILNCDIENIEGGAFNSCANLERVILTNIKKISYGAFGNCSNLKYVDLGKSVEFLGERAFSDASITEIVLPNSMKIVDKDAFYNCIKLKRLEIGSGINQIGDGAFNSGYSGTIELDSMVVSAATPPAITENAFSSKSYLNCKVVVPSESLDLYKSSIGWSNFWSIEGGLVSGIQNEIAKEDKFINIIPNGIQVRHDGLFEIYSIEGQKVLTCRLHKDDTMALNQGWYIVKCESSTQKIYIR